MKISETRLRCPVCKTEDLKDFTPGVVKQNRRGRLCRKCKSDYDAQHYAENAEAYKAQKAQYHAENAKAINARHAKSHASPRGRARAALNSARRREQRRGVPKALQLDAEAWVPVVARELDNGRWSYDLKKKGRRPKFGDPVRGRNGHGDSPSLSRLDHNKPYTGNFVVEPLWLNLHRKQMNSEQFRKWVEEQTTWPEELKAKIQYEPLRLDMLTSEEDA